VRVVGNTANKASGTAVRVATYAVDAFDTVKDYYTDVYRKWRQRKEAEQQAQAHGQESLHQEEPQSVKGGY